MEKLCEKRNQITGLPFSFGSAVGLAFDSTVAATACDFSGKFKSRLIILLFFLSSCSSSRPSWSSFDRSTRWWRISHFSVVLIRRIGSSFAVSAWVSLSLHSVRASSEDQLLDTDADSFRLLIFCTSAWFKRRFENKNWESERIVRTQVGESWKQKRMLKSTSQFRNARDWAKI